MLFLIGYASNAAGIQVEEKIEGEEVIPPFEGLQAAIAFYLAAKCLRVFWFIVYSFALPRFRIPFLVMIAVSIVTVSAYIPLLVLKSSTTFWVLTGLGIFLDVAPNYAFGIFTTAQRRQAKADKAAQAAGGTAEVVKGAGIYIPAINLEHHIERQAQFVIIGKSHQKVHQPLVETLLLRLQSLERRS